MLPEKLLNQQLGPYRIEAILGSGGMSVVYQARGVEGEVVALKVLFPPPGAGPELRLRFEREARTAARLHHPAIVRILDVGQAGDYAYLAMPLVEGQTLAGRLRSSGPLPEEVAADIAWQIADALDYAHRQGVVHRDVKPSNILLAEDGRAFLTDFGVAQALDDPALTRTGHTIGTPAYMAPEQASGERPVDGRADLYALGVALYQMTTGQTPFRGTTPHILYAHLHESPPPPSAAAPVSPAMEAIIIQALAKEPDQRFPSGAAMAQALAGLNDQTGTQAIPAAAAEPAQAAGRNRWLWLLPGALVAALAIWQIGSREASAPGVLTAASATPTVNEAVQAVSSPTPSPDQTAGGAASPTPAETGTASPTPGQPATGTASPTPTASNTATLTLTPSPVPPTASPAAAVPPALPPTGTPTPLPAATPCPQPAASEFAALLAAGEVGQQLGCPRGEAVTIAAAWQPFERGAMLWRADTALIYILEPDSRWRFMADRWREGDLEFDPGLAAPDGLHQPVRGFGLVWREQPGVSELLGWATAEEQGFEALVQEFGGGLVWQDPEQERVFVLLNNGIYQVEN